MSALEEMSKRYAEGTLPWDLDSPPPEVLSLLENLDPGRALDLGCGYGRASIYLAQRGWQVDGVDFVPQATEEAVRRAAKAGVGESVRFHTASVARLDFLQDSYDFALDVGCMHILNEEELWKYADGLRRLLRPGATYLLFARLVQPNWQEGQGPRGVPEASVRSIFEEGFTLEKIEHGETTVEDMPIWRSAWFWFRREEG